MKRAWTSVALAACAGLVAGLASGNAAALEGMTAYDNFSVSPIDPTKWSSFERKRGIGNGMLQMVERDWGQTSSDTGTLANSYSTFITRPSKVTQLKASVLLNAVDVTGCAANSSLSAARARIAGYFFNTGNPVSGNSTGDVAAQVRIIRYSNSTDAPGVARVEGLALVCLNSGCSDSHTIGAVQQLGTLSVGQTAVLQLEWDRANKAFHFMRDTTTTASVTYTLNDSIAPASDGKYVGLRTEVASCQSGPRAYSSIDASFDNVQVNKSAAP